MDSESKYFSSEYELYYGKLKNNELSSQSLKNEVQTVSEEFNNINYYMTSWKGAASNATSAAIDTILNKFSVIKENVDNSLIPASETMTELLLCLESLKEMEEELKAKEEELRSEQSRNVSERVPCGKDEKGKTKYKHNNEYDDWIRNIETLTKDIELLTKDLDEQKLKCDKLIADIKKFESSIRQFSDLVGFSKQLFGLEATESGITGMSLEEKLAYFDSLIDNYSEIYEELNELYTNMYGNGVSFSVSDFEKIDMLFDAFNVYDKAGIKSEDLTKKGDNIVSLLLDVENLQTILRYCNQNDFFKKVENYINGESWEESGIASLYDRDFFAYNEKKFLEEMKKKYGVSDVRTYFKENAEAILSSIKNFNTAYEDHQSLLTLMSSVNAKREQLENAKALVPFEHEMENADFKNYLNKDYSLYNLIDRDKLKYLSKQEVALFDYLYNTKSKEEAENYLKAMDDAINQRIGSSKASEYAAWLLQDGFQATDLVGSGFEGVKDGVRGWWDGVLDLGRVGSTEEGKRSAFDYELMYKSQYIYELAEQYGITDSECSWINQFYQTGSSVGNMIVPMASSFIPVAGQVLSPTLMGLSITGNSAVEARQRGATLGQAYTYGALSGLSESATEVMLGGIPGISKLNNLHLGNKTVNTVANFFANATSEGLEEYTQTYLDAGLNKLIFGDDLPDLAILHKEGVEAFKQGAITSGVLQGVNAGGVKVLDKATASVSSVFGSGVYDSTMPNSFARFKNDIESRFQGTEVQDAINKVASGEEVSFLEKAKINHLLKNTSAEDISSVTYNMDDKSRTNLLQSDVLSTKSRENITLADAMNTIKNNPSKPIMEIDGIDVKALHEEVTADGRTLSEYLIDNAKNPETVIESVRSQGGIEASLTASKMEARLKSNISEQISYQNRVQGTVENSAATIDKYSTKMASGEKLTTFEKTDLNNAVKKVSIEELSGITSNLSVEKRNTLNSEVLGKNTMRRIEASNTIQNAVNNGSVPTDVLTLKRNVSRDGRNMAEYIVDTNPTAITETTINEIAKSSPVFAESLTERIKANAILGVIGGDIQAISPIDTSNDTASTDGSDVLGMGAMVGLTGLGLNSMGVNTKVDTSTTSNQSSVIENNSFNTTMTNSTTRSIDVKTDEQTTTVSKNMMVNETVNHKGSSDTVEQITDGTHANQDGQVLGVDNGQIEYIDDLDVINNGAPFVSQPIFNPSQYYYDVRNIDVINSIRDMENAITRIMSETKCSRSDALVRISEAIRRGGSIYTTTNGVYKDILKSYPRNVITEAYNSHVSMLSVSDKMVSDIVYVIHRTAEMHNISNYEALGMIYDACEKQSIRNIPNIGNARKVFSQYTSTDASSSFNIKAILRKIELYDLVNKDITHLFPSRNYQSTSSFSLFERVGVSDFGTYGVDQGVMYNMFEFVDNSSQKRYSYHEALSLMKEIEKKHGVKPTLIKCCKQEYFEFKDYVVKKYGFSEKDASILISSIDNSGACSYASVCNAIFSFFNGKEAEFEKAFGYPMFEYLDGIKVFNSKKMLLDLYIFANTERNGGRFIISDGKGGYKLNTIFLNRNVDPLGRNILDTKKQVFLSNPLKMNDKVINSFLSSKGYQYKSFNKKNVYDKLNISQIKAIANDVKVGLSKGRLYDLGIYSERGVINFISANPKVFSSISTLTWSEGDGHATFITDVTNDSFVVSSWGMKFYVPFSDLVDGSWCLQEAKITPNVNLSSSFEHILKYSKGSDPIINYFKTSNVNNIYRELSKLDNVSLNYLYGILGNTDAKLQPEVISCISSFVSQDNLKLIDFFNNISNVRKNGSVLIQIANNIPTDTIISIMLTDNKLNSKARDTFIENAITSKDSDIELSIPLLQEQCIESINRVVQKSALKGIRPVVKLNGDLRDPNISRILYSIDSRATILINGNIINRNILLINEVKSNPTTDVIEGMTESTHADQGGNVVDVDNGQVGLTDIYNHVQNPIDDPKVIEKLITMYSERLNNGFYNRLVRTIKKQYNKGEYYQEDVDKFYSMMFNKWKNSIVAMTRDEFEVLRRSEGYGQDFIKMRNYLKNIPDVLTMKEADNIFFGNKGDTELEKALEKYRWTAFGDDGFSSWRHVCSRYVAVGKDKYPKIEHRLYLDTESVDTYKMITYLVEKCDEHHLPYYFKFDQFSRRDDTIVIYSSTEDLTKYVVILQEIKKEHPDLVSRVKEPPILTGKIGGWIGYGSEPSEFASSFNYVRSNAIESAIEKVTKKWIMEHRNVKITYQGQVLSFQEYIAMRSTETLISHMKYLFDFSEETGKKAAQMSGKVYNRSTVVDELGYTLQDLDSLRFKQSICRIISNSLKKSLPVICNSGYKDVEDVVINVRNGKQVIFKGSDLEKAIVSLPVEIVKNDPNFISIVKEQININAKQHGIDTSKFCFDTRFTDKMKPLSDSFEHILKNSKDSDPIINYFKTNNANSIYRELSKLDNVSLNYLYGILGNTDAKLQPEVISCISSFVSQDNLKLIDFFNNISNVRKNGSVLIQIANNISTDTIIPIMLTDNKLNSKARDTFIENAITNKDSDIELSIPLLQEQCIESINRVVQKSVLKGIRPFVRLKGDLRDPNISRILYSVDSRATILINGTIINSNILSNNETVKSNPTFDENIFSDVKFNKDSTVTDKKNIQTDTSVITNSEISTKYGSNTATNTMSGFTEPGFNSLGVNPTIDTSIIFNQNNVVENTSSVMADNTATNSTTRSADIKTAEQNMAVGENMMAYETVNHTDSSDAFEQITDNTYNLNQDGQVLGVNNTSFDTTVDQIQNAPEKVADVPIEYLETLTTSMFSKKGNMAVRTERQEKIYNLYDEIIEKVKPKMVFMYGMNVRVYENVIGYVNQLDNIYDQIVLTQVCRDYSLANSLISKFNFDEYALKKYQYLLSLNSNINDTVNLEFLQPKYSFLDNKLDYFTTDIRIQQKIISLSDERLRLFQIIYAELENYDGYMIPYIEKVLDCIGSDILSTFNSKYLELIKDLEDYIVSGHSLSTEEIEGVLYLFTSDFELPIKSLDDLREFCLNGGIVEKFIEYAVDKYEKSELTDAKGMKKILFYRTYGISEEVAEEIAKCYDFTGIHIDDSTIDLYEMCNAIKYIYQENDLQKLMMIYKNFSNIMKPKPNFMRTTVLRTELRRLFSRQIMSEVYKTDEAHYVTINGVNVYNSGLDFKMLVTAVGGFNSEYGKQENYSEYWNAPKIISHGNCCSLIANNNLSMVDPKNVIFGFSSMNENMLLLCGCRDLDSSPLSIKFNIIADNLIDNRFFSPEVLINNTRGDFNELVYERRDLDTGAFKYKKNPDYIVFIQEYENIENYISMYQDNPELLEYLLEQKKEEQFRWQESLRAAKDFNIPIVRIVRENCAKNELYKINEFVKQFLTNPSPDLIEKIIVQFINNRMGNGVLKHKIIESTYFSSDIINDIVDVLLKRIDLVADNEKKYKLVEKFRVIIKKELSKTYSSRTHGQSCGIDLKNLLEKINKVRC